MFSSLNSKLQAFRHLRSPLADTLFLMHNQRTFFIDVDNTLLNNDHVKDEIKKSLIAVLGQKEAGHFWHHHDEFRAYEKFIDFPRIIKQYCGEVHKEKCEMIFLQIFNSIEFTHVVYPDSMAVLAHLKTIGTVYLFTEGDRVYQHMKVRKSGLEAVVDGVFLYDHKLDHVTEVVKEFADSRKIFIDDRVTILQAIKTMFPAVYTINVRQGHYNEYDKNDTKGIDKTIQTIGELLKLEKEF